jgi:hypothetical protein
MTSFHSTLIFNVSLDIFSLLLFHEAAEKLFIQFELASTVFVSFMLQKETKQVLSVNHEAVQVVSFHRRYSGFELRLIEAF